MGDIQELYESRGMSDARLAGWDGAVFVASGESRGGVCPAQI